MTKKDEVSQCGCWSHLICLIGRIKGLGPQEALVEVPLGVDKPRLPGEGKVCCAAICWEAHSRRRQARHEKWSEKYLFKHSFSVYEFGILSVLASETQYELFVFVLKYICVHYLVNHW